MEHLIGEHKIHNAVLINTWAKVFMITAGEATAMISMSRRKTGKRKTHVPMP